MGSVKLGTVFLERKFCQQPLNQNLLLFVAFPVSGWLFPPSATCFLCFPRLVSAPAIVSLQFFLFPFVELARFRVTSEKLMHFIPFYSDSLWSCLAFKTALVSISNWPLHIEYFMVLDRGWGGERWVSFNIIPLFRQLPLLQMRHIYSCNFLLPCPSLTLICLQSLALLHCCLWLYNPGSVSVSL